MASYFDPYTKTEIPNALTSAWLDTYKTNLAELESYYLGDPPATMLTYKQSTDHKRFWRPINITAVVVNEPIGYLAQGSIKVEATVEGDPDPELTQWATAFFTRRLRPRLDDLIKWQGLYGHAFVYLWTDLTGQSQGLKARVLPPVEGGKARVMADFGGEDEEELTAAVLYYTQPQPGARTTVDYRVTLTMETIRVERRTAAEHVYQLVREEKNAYGVLPLITCYNPSASDILDLMPLQDDLNKLYFDRRMSREYHGFPMLAIEPTVMNGMPIDTNPIEVGPGKVIRNAKAYRIEPGNLDQLRAERDSILEDAAMITSSLALMDRTGNALSGVALRFLQQGLENKLQAKATGLEAALTVALQTAARMITASDKLRDLERADGLDLESAEFTVTVAARIPADEEAQAKRAKIIRQDLGASRETTLGMVGVEDPAAEIERAKAETAEHPP